uniref:Polynucleotide 5'-hydroxyl-kinase GRC3 n=1 Tax=Blastobotrys adeninivorans TaxID=409370 RepID=A0A060T9K1_BLAAD
MSLPGLSSGAESEGQTHLIDLAAGSEWRVEVPATSQLNVTLLDGTAEVFGTELAVGAQYSFVGQNTAIYTWYGCKLQYSSTLHSSISTSSATFSEYTSDETPMTVYANLHFALETLRNESKPPSVLVLGPPYSGKTSICKILASYANKTGRFPMVVNLDPAMGVYSCPGGLSAAPVSDILDVEDSTGGWGSSQVNGPALLHPKSPLVYYYGLETPQKNSKYFKHVASRLALGVQARLSADKKVRESGIIIDTPGTGMSDSAVSSVIADFKVTVVVVVGNERLYSDLAKRYKEKTNLTVLKVPKSGGCVDLDPPAVRATQSRSMRDYFYGTIKQTLDPYSVTVDYSAVTVYRVLEESELDSSALPAGEQADSQHSAQHLVKLETSAILQNCVMAMLNASPADSVDLLVQSEVLGYVHVITADDDRRKLVIRMPVPGRLPQRPFVIGDYRYHE